VLFRSQNQIDALREVAERCGYQITQIFSEDGISGSKGREGRPALDQLMKSATQRKFDMVMCWSIDRLGRSLQNLVEILNELQAMKMTCSFYNRVWIHLHRVVG
jgi:DNA invertase Pin-like site-specific DNA recombinase